MNERVLEITLEIPVRLARLEGSTFEEMVRTIAGDTARTIRDTPSLNRVLIPERLTSSAVYHTRVVHRRPRSRVVIMGRDPKTRALIASGTRRKPKPGQLALSA